MARKRIGKLKPEHSLLLNPYNDVRLSRCPRCDKLTYPREFTFLVHTEGIGPVITTMGCKYCSKCRLILLQQDEIEDYLARKSEVMGLGAIGHEYFILGVIEKSGRDARQLEDVLEHLSDIKNQYGMGLIPGGWYHPEHPPKPLPARREQIIKRHDTVRPRGGDPGGNSPSGS